MRPDERDDDAMYAEQPEPDDGADAAMAWIDAADCLDAAVRDMRRNEVRARMNNTRYAD